MKRKIALIGLKGTGKDYITNLVFQRYYKLTVGDLIKLEAFKHHIELCTNEDPDGKTFNKHFLNIDKNKLLKNKKYFNEVKKYYEYSLQNKDVPFLDFIKKDIMLLESDEVLKLINLYKRFPFLTTRNIIHGFYVLQDSEGYDYWSIYMSEQVKKYRKKDLIFTDCRMLIEAVDFLLKGGVLLTLYNTRSRDLVYNCNNFLHSTESQLGSLQGKKGIGLVVDVTSRDKIFITNTINEHLNIFYSNFRGLYSIDFRKKLKEFRDILLKDISSIERDMDTYYENKEFYKYQIERKKLNIYQTELRNLVKEEYSKYMRF